MLLKPNESICIQGAFLLLYAGGSKRAATWERVQRSGGGGGSGYVFFPKHTSKGHAWISIEFTSFFFLPPSLKYRLFFKERVEVEKVYSHTLNPPALRSALYPLSVATLCFSVRIENSRGGFGTKGRGLQYSLCSRRVAAADVLTSE